MGVTITKVNGGSKYLSRIYEIEERVKKEKDGREPAVDSYFMPNAICLRGDYATGKTAHSVPMILKQYEVITGKKPTVTAIAMTNALHNLITSEFGKFDPGNSKGGFDIKHITTEEFFNDKVEIHNHAKNGRSTKSFIDQGLWQAVLDLLQPDDYVMIQFGHNDQKMTDSSRYTDPHGAYKRNLQRYVKESREKGAQPILITPVMRRRFDEHGQFYDVHGDYPGVVREVAAQMQVPLIDLHQTSRDLFASLGEEKTKEIFLWVEPGKYTRFPDGKQDNTHFSESGARQIAGLVVNGIKALDLKLKDHLKK